MSHLPNLASAAEKMLIVEVENLPNILNQDNIQRSVNVSADVQGKPKWRSYFRMKQFDFVAACLVFQKCSH